MPLTARRVGFSTSKEMPGRWHDLDGVAVAQVELQLLADELGTIADAGDLEALAVAGGHAGDHVGDERARQSVQLPRALVVRGTLDEQLTVLLDDAQLGRDVARQLTPRALDGDVGAVDRDLDAGWERRWASRPMRDMATYQTYARTSPPSWPLRACAPVMIPWLVLTMTTTQAAEHARNVGLGGVDAQARLADALQAA